MDGPRGAVAFRADERGVVLAGRRKAELCAPWGSIAEIVLFHQAAGAVGMPYVGLRLVPGAPPVPAGLDRDGGMWRTNRGPFPHVPQDVLAYSRPVSGWRLDEEKLARIIAVHAPHVRIVRLAGGRTGPVRGRPAGEGFLARQRRLLIKADFRRNESVALGHGNNSLDNYLSGGPASRFFNRMWNLVVASTGLAFLTALVIIVTDNSPSAWWTIPFNLAMCYFAGYHFAGWRCMRRHRNVAR